MVRWPDWSDRLARGPLLVLAMLCLALAVWGGVVRLHWSPVPLNAFNVNWATFHGPLLVCGFLGTVIGLERAAAMQRPWAYVGPLATGIGGLLLVTGHLGIVPPVLFVVGAASLLAITGGFLAKHPSQFLAVMTAGAAAWLVGNLLWLNYWPVHRVVLWWTGFLALTILAERIELNRFLRPTPRQRRSILVVVAVFVAGAAGSAQWPIWGERLAGLGLLGMAGWLLRYDIARRTIRHAGQPRFIAVCLLIGYGWLAVAGFLWLIGAPLPAYGGRYDAALHAFFLGYVISMIFGHAPIVLPAVMRVEAPFRRTFYGHLVLLHVALALRLVGDLTQQPTANGLGGLGAGVAIVLFAVNTVASAAIAARQRAMAVN